MLLGAYWNFSDIPNERDDVGYQRKSGSGADIAKSTRMTRGGHRPACSNEAGFSPYKALVSAGTIPCPEPAAPGAGVFPITVDQRNFSNSSRGDGEASWKIGTLVGSQLSLLEV